MDITEEQIAQFLASNNADIALLNSSADMVRKTSLELINRYYQFMFISTENSSDGPNFDKIKKIFMDHLDEEAKTAIDNGNITKILTKLCTKLCEYNDEYNINNIIFNVIDQTSFHTILDDNSIFCKIITIVEDCTMLDTNKYDEIVDLYEHKFTIDRDIKMLIEIQKDILDYLILCYSVAVKYSKLIQKNKNKLLKIKNKLLTALEKLPNNIKATIDINIIRANLEKEEIIEILEILLRDIEDKTPYKNLMDKVNMWNGEINYKCQLYIYSIWVKIRNNVKMYIQNKKALKELSRKNLNPDPHWDVGKNFDYLPYLTSHLQNATNDPNIKTYITTLIDEWELTDEKLKQEQPQDCKVLILYPELSKEYNQLKGIQLLTKKILDNYNEQRKRRKQRGQKQHKLIKSDKVEKLAKEYIADYNKYNSIKSQMNKTIVDDIDEQIKTLKFFEQKLTKTFSYQWYTVYKMIKLINIPEEIKKEDNIHVKLATCFITNFVKSYNLFMKDNIVNDYDLSTFNLIVNSQIKSSETTYFITVMLLNIVDKLNYKTTTVTNTYYTILYSILPHFWYINLFLTAKEKEIIKQNKSHFRLLKDGNMEEYVELCENVIKKHKTGTELEKEIDKLDSYKLDMYNVKTKSYNELIDKGIMDFYEQVEN